MDRVYFGVVTDFVLWHLPEKTKNGQWKHQWPVFNVADIALVVGVVLMFFDPSDKKKKKDKAKKSE
jgi:lipoprotein signal peptidase